MNMCNTYSTRRHLSKLALPVRDEECAFALIIIIIIVAHQEANAPPSKGASM